MEWSGGPDSSELLKRLASLKKNPILTDSRYEVEALSPDILRATHRRGERQLVGVFSVRGNSALVPVDAPDGVYPDLASGGEVEVYGGMVGCKGRPVIFETPWTGGWPV